MKDFVNKWIAVAGMPAALLVAAAVFAHRTGGAWKGNAKTMAWKGHIAKAALSAARRVTISSGGIKAEPTVDAVDMSATKFGRVVCGTGTVELGGVLYTAKSVAGFLGGDAACFTIYTGNAIIKIKYYNDMYYAVAKPLGTAGFQRFNVTATLTA